MAGPGDGPAIFVMPLPFGTGGTCIVANASFTNPS